MVENTIELHRGFVVSKLSQIVDHGFSLGNPKEKGFVGESNWPGGLSLGRLDGFDIAFHIAQEHGGIPVNGKVIINERHLSEICLVGIKRGEFGDIDYWRCNTWGDVFQAWEFTIVSKFLNPNWLQKLRASLRFEDGEYQDFYNFRQKTNETRPLIKRLLKF